MKSTSRIMQITVLSITLIPVARSQVQQPGASGARRLGLPSRPSAEQIVRVDGPAQPSESPAMGFTFGMVDFPGQMDSGVSAINDKGAIVGGYGTNGVGDGVSNHGFLLKGTKFTAIDYPGAAWTEANDISNSGVIVGEYGASFSENHGFKLVGKTFTPIDYPGADDTSANGINKWGNIVGSWFSGGVTHGFLLSNGVFTSLDYPGAAYTVAVGINKAGHIVGMYSNTGTDSHGFLYSSGTFTTIDYPGGYSQNYADGINDSDVIVGGYGEPTTVNGVAYAWEHGFIYEGGQFTNIDVPFGPPAATQPFRINNNAVIVGEYVDNSDTVYGYEATVAP